MKTGKRWLSLLLAVVMVTSMLVFPAAAEEEIAEPEALKLYETVYAEDFSGETLDFEIPEEYRDAQKLISNYHTESEALRPYEAVMLYYERK